MDQWGLGNGGSIHSPKCEDSELGEAEEFKREVEAEYESEENGEPEWVAVTSEKVSVNDAVGLCP